MRIDDVTPQSLAAMERGLRALAEDLGDDYRAESAALHDALFGALPACHGMLAQENGALFGVALFSPVMSTVTGQPGVYVSDLWVAPETRGAGVGPKLLAAVSRRGRALWNAGYLRLVSYDGNSRALDFYDRLGFVRHDQERVLFLGGAGFDKLARIE